MPMFSLPRVCGVLLVLCITVGLGVPPTAAQPTLDGAVPIDSVQTQRLTSLAQLYGVAAFYHPDLGNGTAAWDSAFAMAAEQIATTTDRSAYAQAVRDLLGAVGDPVTRLRSGPSPQTPPATSGDAPDAMRWAADSVLVATMNPSTIRNQSDAVRFSQRLQAQLPQAQGVVMDVRNAGFIPVGRFLDSQRGIMARLAPEPYALPQVQTRMHEGFVPEGGSTSGEYASYTRTRTGSAIQPAAATTTGPFVLLASAGGTIPRFALALQQAGRGVVIQEGSDEPVYASVPTHTVSLADGLTAEVRLGRLVTADGTRTAPAAITVEPSADTTDAALDRALAFARGGAPLPAVSPASPIGALGASSAAYTGDAYPSAGDRVLAVARGWSIIEHFFPYKDLMDAPWREALPTAIEAAVEAEDAEAYHLAIARLMVQTNDSHVSARSSVLSRLRGEAPAPVLVRSIEGEPVVTNIVDDAVADTSGLEQGDIILAVDGTPAPVRMDSLSRFYRAASTPQARQHHVASRLLWGDPGSIATVRVRGADGAERTVALPRGRYRLSHEMPVMERLTDRIGYADLDRLERAQVDSMFTRFADTDAIIFDMRGYPNGTAWAIAPRLAETNLPVAASFAKPLRLGPGPRDRQTIDFDQPVPPRRGAARYTGKTVMLIDERAISQAEHTGLFLKAANGTTFIGSPTDGANGDVTRFRLPGGIRVGFTGQAVSYPDGTQLQRRGLQPDVAVRPTIVDIRRGEDVVLQTAIEYLQGELDATEP